MAVNHKTQWIKLGIGTLSVVAIVGVTGVISQKAQPKDVGTALLEQAGLADNGGTGWQLDDDEEYDDYDDDDDDDHRVRLARPSVTNSTVGRTRTRRS